MAHELQDDSFHEIQLSGKQLVFLFMATTVVSIVIFLCGVLVGRGVPADRAAGEASETTGVPLEEQASMAPGSNAPTSEEGLSYPARLSKAERESESERVSPPKAAAPSAAPARVDAPQPTRAPSPTPAPAAKATAPAAAPPATTATAPGAASARGPAAAPAPAPETTAAPPSGDGGFTVQVTALKNRPDADTLARRLQSRGFQAYVVAPNGGGPVIYKVRVGMNMQRQEADKVMRRLQNEEKFKPWITR